MDVTKPYEFTGSGAMDVTKPYEFIGFGAVRAPEGPRSLDSQRWGTRGQSDRAGGSPCVLTTSSWSPLGALLVPYWRPTDANRAGYLKAVRLGFLKCISEIWPAPGLRKGGGRSPPPFGGLSRAPGAGQTSKTHPTQIRPDCLQVPSCMRRRFGAGPELLAAAVGGANVQHVLALSLLLRLFSGVRPGPGHGVHHVRPVLA